MEMQLGPSFQGCGGHPKESYLRRKVGHVGDHLLHLLSELISRKHLGNKVPITRFLRCQLSPGQQHLIGLQGIGGFSIWHKRGKNECNSISSLSWSHNQWEEKGGAPLCTLTFDPCASPYTLAGPIINGKRREEHPSGL